MKEGVSPYLNRLLEPVLVEILFSMTKRITNMGSKLNKGKEVLHSTGKFFLLVPFPGNY